MNLKEIKELIELVADKRLAEFEIEKGGVKLKIRQMDGVLPVPLPAPIAIATPPPLPTVAPTPPTASESAAQPPPAKSEKQLHIIKAPIVGTFYRAPSPTAEVFVKIGSQVESGTVLCIIEAMKLMNEIESDVAGEVAEIYVDNSRPVEYGQPLFGIRLD
ncbi:MAG: acetyl-CoA carboxylase biotin carboxyl carrier protein [Acidobacteriota bacterium]